MSGVLNTIASGVGTAAQTIYTLAFQVSPIILQGGIATAVPGGMLPIIGLTGQLASLALSAVTSESLSVNDFYAQYIPIPGGTVINNAIGMYPFANQFVAANAIIQQPLNISLLMIAPVNQTAGYLTKLALFSALQSSLQQHNVLGGRYCIATPAMIYNNCLMTGMTDVTPPESRQLQIEWRLDFIQPLVTQAAAAAALGTTMQAVTNGSQTSGGLSWSSATSTATSAVGGALGSVAGYASSLTQFLSGTVL
jgi:hypothetical protein